MRAFVLIPKRISSGVGRGVPPHRIILYNGIQYCVQLLLCTVHSSSTIYIYITTHLRLISSPPFAVNLSNLVIDGMAMNTHSNRSNVYPSSNKAGPWSDQAVIHRKFVLQRKHRILILEFSGLCADLYNCLRTTSTFPSQASTNHPHLGTSNMHQQPTWPRHRVNQFSCIATIFYQINMAPGPSWRTRRLQGRYYFSQSSY